MWVPLIENGEYNQPGADYFVRKHLDHLLGQSADIDAILLACTHYPLLMEKIRQLLPKQVQVIAQGAIVAKSLAEYLQRHPAMAAKCSKNGQMRFCTTDDAVNFDQQAAIFYGRAVASEQVDLIHS